MWNIIKEYRHYLATLALVIIPIIAVNSGGKSPAEIYWFDRTALAISAPAQKAIHWSLDSLWSVFESYVFLLNTQKNNQELAQESRRLLNEIAGFTETAKENERLRKIVDFHMPLEGKKVVAQIIAQDISPEFRMIRLNKGVDHGIELGMAVLALEGVVGRVIRVGKNWSDVLTLLDFSSAIDAVLQRNRVRGVIEGLGNNTLTLKYLRRTDEVQVGDLIVSSGIGGLFPKGVNIGTVASVKKKNYGISQIVEVTPSVDFNKLEEVTVISPAKIFKEEIPVASSLKSDKVNKPAPEAAKPKKSE